jgi:SAM-dependent methyltransferase
MGAGGSVSFDRIADRYDATRGGTERGGRLAAGIAPWLQPGPVLEIGIGTGAVALPLRELGHPVAGIDLSLPMLRTARERLGAAVAVGDAYAPPIRPASARNVVVVWVTQLVPDLAGFVRSGARLLAPGGRLVVVPAGFPPQDEIGRVTQPMSEALRPRRDAPDQLAAAAGACGLRVLSSGTVDLDDVWYTSPTEQAEQIEARAWSILWDVPDEAWQRHVVPTVSALRALPEPDRLRPRSGVFDLVVLERP